MAQDEFEEDVGEAPSNINLLEVAAFVRQAAIRHWLLGSVLALFIAGLGITAAMLLPPKYEAHSRVFVAEADSVAPIEGGSDMKDPTRGVTEKVLRSENLRGIVREAKLDETWDAQRAPILKLKDRLTGSISELPEDLRIKVLAGTLQGRLKVWVEGSTLHFQAEWGDAETAAKIVNIARNRYLEEKLQEELAVLNAAIKLLEREVTQAAESIEPRLQAVDRAYHQARAAAIPKHEPSDEEEKTVVVYRKATEAAPAEPDPKIAEKLGKIRSEIRAIQEPYERRLAELKAKLSELRTVYGPQHPQVAQQQRRIEAATPPPPELAELRAEERNLLASIQRMSTVPDEYQEAAQPVRVRTTTQRATSSAAPASPPDPGNLHDSATISAERSKLVASIEKYGSLTSRLDNTRLEVTTAKIAFKYRYAILEEAEPPPSRTQPKLPLLIVLGSVVFAVVVGFVAGAARELATGKMLDVWQVRQLGLPLLAEVDFNETGS